MVRSHPRPRWKWNENPSSNQIKIHSSRDEVYTVSQLHVHLFCWMVEAYQINIELGSSLVLEAAAY